jgi:hypothetical protein
MQNHHFTLVWIDNVSMFVKAPEARSRLTIQNLPSNSSPFPVCCNLCFLVSSCLCLLVSECLHLRLLLCSASASFFVLSVSFLVALSTLELATFLNKTEVASVLVASVRAFPAVVFVALAVFLSPGSF